MHLEEIILHGQDGGMVVSQLLPGVLLLESLGKVGGVKCQ